MPCLILASHSIGRAALLKAAGYTFEQHPSNAPEPPRPEGQELADYALELAEVKARAVARTFPEACVLAADTAIELDGQTIGKPADLEEAVRMLHWMGGRTHGLASGLCIIAPGHAEPLCAVDTARVTMRAWPEPRIRRFVDSARPLRFAGAYALQAEGAVMVDHLDGDPSTVIGLPMGPAEDLLARCGILP